MRGKIDSFFQEVQQLSTLIVESFFHFYSSDNISGKARYYNALEFRLGVGKKAWFKSWLGYCL